MSHRVASHGLCLPYKSLTSSCIVSDPGDSSGRQTNGSSKGSRTQQRGGKQGLRGGGGSGRSLSYPKRGAHRSWGRLQCKQTNAVPLCRLPWDTDTQRLRPGAPLPCTSMKPQSLVSGSLPRTPPFLSSFQRLEVWVVGKARGFCPRRSEVRNQWAASSPSCSARVCYRGTGFSARATAQPLRPCSLYHNAVLSYICRVWAPEKGRWGSQLQHQRGKTWRIHSQLTHRPSRLDRAASKWAERRDPWAACGTGSLIVHSACWWKPRRCRTGLESRSPHEHSFGWSTAVALPAGIQPFRGCSLCASSSSLSAGVRAAATRGLIRAIAAVTNTVVHKSCRDLRGLAAPAVEDYP